MLMKRTLTFALSLQILNTSIYLFAGMLAWLLIYICFYLSIYVFIYLFTYLFLLVFLSRNYFCILNIIYYINNNNKRY